MSTRKAKPGSSDWRSIRGFRRAIRRISTTPPCRVGAGVSGYRWLAAAALMPPRPWRLAGAARSRAIVKSAERLRSRRALLDGTSRHRPSTTAVSAEVRRRRVDLCTATPVMPRIRPFAQDVSATAGGSVRRIRLDRRIIARGESWFKARPSSHSAIANPAGLQAGIRSAETPGRRSTRSTGNDEIRRDPVLGVELRLAEHPGIGLGTR